MVVVGKRLEEELARGEIPSVEESEIDAEAIRESIRAVLAESKAG